MRGICFGTQKLLNRFRNQSGEADFLVRTLSARLTGTGYGYAHKEEASRRRLRIGWSKGPWQADDGGGRTRERDCGRPGKTNHAGANKGIATSAMWFRVFRRKLWFLTWTAPNDT